MNMQKRNLPKESEMCGNRKGGPEMNTYQVIDEKTGRGPCTVWFSGEVWSLLSV